MRRVPPLVFVAFCAYSCGASATAPAPSPSPSSRSGFTYSGLTHVSWSPGEYEAAAAQQSRAALSATGAPWAGVIVTWYMSRPDSSSIGPDPSRTPSDADVVAAIQGFHARGLRVMLKPHVDVEDGTWRGTITPRTPSAWFQAYDAFLLKYAALGAAEGVELLVIGTELATMSDSRYASEWQDLIGRIRGAFHGPITYAANAVTAGDEFTSVSFWTSLDLAGLDAYAPLSDKPSPTTQDLINGWSLNPSGENMLEAYRSLQASLGKPVIFTELGYRSVSGAATAPWDFELRGAYDSGVQANAYQAAFEVYSTQTSWFAGIFWWDWPVPLPKARDTDYTPRGKPAEDILRSWQAP